MGRLTEARSVGRRRPRSRTAAWAGHGIRFAFRPEGAACVYVFNVDPRGSVACLFPDYYATLHAEQVKAGKAEGPAACNPVAPQDGVVLIPPIVSGPAGRRMLMRFKFDATTGREWFLLAVARAPVPEPEEARIKLRRGELGAAELRALAERLRAGRGAAVPGSGAEGASLLIHKDDGEHALGAGWRGARGPGVAVWTLELDHE